MGKNKKDVTMPWVLKTAGSLDPDPAHGRQVTKLALALFYGLRSLHGFGPAEARLLEIAAHMHDIGWSEAGSGKHHKVSGKLIRKLDIPGMTVAERLTCALIARYHTKALPVASRHRRFASLGPPSRGVVEWLAGMLRVADGLDYDHAHPISRLSCSVNDEAVIIHLDAAGDCRGNIERARHKHLLLERKVERQIEYRC